MKSVLIENSVGTEEQLTKIVDNKIKAFILERQNVNLAETI